MGRRERQPQVDDRQRRRALNEAAFRQINERLRSLNEAFGEFSGRFSVVCECDDSACVDEISMTPAEYEGVRSKPVLFFVRPGHQSPAVETVVEERGEYYVVRKHEGEPAEIAEATDPRT
jgi:hypothetical protein